MANSKALATNDTTVAPSAIAAGAAEPLKNALINSASNQAHMQPDPTIALPSVASKDGMRIGHPQFPWFAKTRTYRALVSQRLSY